jgi:hypothetical protein
MPQAGPAACSSMCSSRCSACRQALPTLHHCVGPPARPMSLHRQAPGHHSPTACSAHSRSQVGPDVVVPCCAVAAVRPACASSVGHTHIWACPKGLVQACRQQCGRPVPESSTGHSDGWGTGTAGGGLWPKHTASQTENTQMSHLFPGWWRLRSMHFVPCCTPRTATLAAGWHGGHTRSTHLRVNCPASASAGAAHARGISRGQTQTCRQAGRGMRAWHASSG